MRPYFFQILMMAMLTAAAVVQADPSSLKIEYKPDGRRDPFVPLIGKNVQIKNVKFLKSIDEVKIEGILMDSREGSITIVNGQVLKEGEFIGGFKVDKISPEQVQFSREGQTYPVSFGKSAEEVASEEEE